MAGRMNGGKAPLEKRDHDYLVYNTARFFQQRCKTIVAYHIIRVASRKFAGDTGAGGHI